MNHEHDLRKTLITRRTELEERVHRIDTQLNHREEPPAADFAEQASEQENLEVLRALESEGRSELALLEAALARLDTGEHGRCQRCGGDIAPARLSALPWTDCCIACAH
jgi:RNA polymerase-binding transcription factor DksA